MQEDLLHTESWKENLMKSDYRYGNNWEQWYKNKDCYSCKYFDGYVSDGFIRCSYESEKVTLPFVQFHERDCDKFEPKEVNK